MKAARTLIRFAMLANVILATPAALAQASHHDDIQVDQPWARPTPPVKPINGAAYFVMINHSDKPVRLTGVSTSVTDMASIHQTREDDGTVRMDAVEGGVELPAGETLRFEPNGYHVMLMKLDAPLREGETFPLTLEFAHHDDVQLDVLIRQGPPDTADEMSGHHH